MYVLTYGWTDGCEYLQTKYLQKKSVCMYVCMYVCMGMDGCTYIRMDGWTWIYSDKVLMYVQTDGRMDRHENIQRTYLQKKKIKQYVCMYVCMYVCIFLAFSIIFLKYIQSTVSFTISVPCVINLLVFLLLFFVFFFFFFFFFVVVVVLNMWCCITEISSSMIYSLPNLLSNLFELNKP